MRSFTKVPSVLIFHSLENSDTFILCIEFDSSWVRSTSSFTHLTLWWPHSYHRLLSYGHNDNHTIILVLCIAWSSLAMLGVHCLIHRSYQDEKWTLPLSVCLHAHVCAHVCMSAVCRKMKHLVTVFMTCQKTTKDRGKEPKGPEPGSSCCNKCWMDLRRF